MYVNADTLTADVNFSPMRNYFPAARGPTLATIGSASSPDGTSYAFDPTKSMSENSTPVADNTVGGKPVAWWTGIAIVLVLMVWLARKTGEAGEFSNIRASTYNVLFVTFTAILGLTFLKIVAVKMQKVPGLSGLSSVIIAA